MDARDEEIQQLKARIAELDRYQRVFEVASIGVTISSSGGELLDVNPAALRLLGMAREEVIGRTAAELGLLPPEGRDQPAAPVLTGRGPGSARAHESTLRPKSGALHEVALTVDRVEIEGAPGFISTFFDITAQKRAVESLAASEARYRQIVETAREGIFIVDTQGNITFVNRRLEEIYGYAPGQLLGKHMFDLLCEEEHVHVQQLLNERLAGIGGGGELRARRSDGSEGWIQFESTSITDEEGTATGALTMVLDISERRRAEDRLRKSEAQLREAQEVGHIGSWDWDFRSKVVTRSAELCRIFGKSQEELGHGEGTSAELVHPDDRERYAAEVAQSIARGGTYAIDYRIVRPDGVRFIHTQGHVISDEAGRPVRALGTVQDVTERKQVEARLMLADRMASLGTLAAGVAHEINNPLAYVIANLDLIAEEIREPAGGSSAERHRELTELTTEARQGSERIRKIVRGLKTLSHVDEEHREVLDVRQVLDGAIDIAFNEVRHRARLVKDYHAVPAVLADEAKLAQVFLNLIVNAAQALPHGQADRNEIRVATRKDASGRVCVEVHDTGAGMSREVLGRIFDPFFTTKPIGVGTGLGLSICHGIVSALGGEITVESEPNEGTAFRVFLPAAPRGEVQPEPPKVASARPGKRGRVLVVDDEALVGNTLRRILKDHHVTVFTDAREARDHIAAGERYDLILCDLMMPDMTGMDLHDELARKAPEQAERMIFVTGGAFTQTAMAFLDRVPNERLDKPFDPINLRALVQRILR